MAWVRNLGAPAIAPLPSKRVGPLAGRLKCDKNEAFLAAIMAREDWRAGWRLVRDFFKIFRKSRADRWELTAPSSWALIAAKNSSFFGYFRRSNIGGGDYTENEAYIAAIRERKRVAQIGGGLVEISPGYPGNR